MSNYKTLLFSLQNVNGQKNNRHLAIEPKLGIEIEKQIFRDKILSRAILELH
jgi:hypothetical protein